MPKPYLAAKARILSFYAFVALIFPPFRDFFGNVA
ncbi:MAG: hypothetical protein K0Q79_3648 [Flavipsychrobacter sp.]|jgi:hypothetical protein|nr:hypothetical protein [Flavipsychrobacter sp.]